MFKFIFANPRRKNLLISLINAVLKKEYEIVDIFVINGEITPEDYYGRKCMLDILCITKDKDLINLEMYSGYYATIMDKNLFYLARLHGEQDVSFAVATEENKKQRDLYKNGIHSTIGISILATGTVSENTPYLSEYVMMEKTSSHIATEKFKLFTLELSKLAKEKAMSATIDGKFSVLYWWGKFFSTKSEKELEALMKDKDAPEIIKEAAMSLEYVNKYDKLKAIMQDNVMKEVMYNEDLNMKFIEGKEIGEEIGIKKGEEIGIKKVKIIMIKELIAENFTIEKIAKILKIPTNEINSLITE